MQSFFMEKELARAADKLIGFQRTCIEVSLNLPRTLNVSYSLDPWQGIPGRSQKLAPGWYDDAKSQILIRNDQTSSIKVPERLAVRALEHAWFQGAFIDFTADIPAVLMDWNDRISSLVVYQAADAPPIISHLVALDYLWDAG